jgi:hypothetical protein
MSRVGVTINGFWIGRFYLLTPYSQTRNCRQLYSAIADLHTLRFTVTHSLGFSVFTSRILATDFITASLSLQITHEIFFAKPNSFLAIILQLPIPKSRLSSIPMFSSSYPGRLASRNSTLFSWSLLYNHFARTTHKTQPLSCLEGVFTAPLQSNGSYSRDACIFVAAEICLASRCLAMNVYSDFFIPAFGCHVTLISGLNVGLHYSSTLNMVVADPCKTLVPVDVHQTTRPHVPHDSYHQSYLQKRHRFHSYLRPEEIVSAWKLLVKPIDYVHLL